MSSQSHHEFASYDAAYVLGALSPQDRQAYEEHLNECAECARSVRELAGVPGLLGKVPADLAVPDHGDEPVPETLLPRLLRVVRRDRLRVRWVAWGSAGLAAAACLLLILAVVLRPGASPEPGTPGVAAPSLSMSPHIQAPITASVALQPVAWGTRIDMTCTYGGSTRIPGLVYELVVFDYEGHAQRVGSWKVLPGRTARLEGATSWQREDISRVEIQSRDGTPLLSVST